MLDRWLNYAANVEENNPEVGSPLKDFLGK
jgi:hypothetical protein